tara:strand:- start:537 stop:980 length:444 start_codon:yes stop_codon:yes gene_type:complete
MIHSARKQASKKRRVCSSCGKVINKGDHYWSRNASLRDEKGRRVYGFFSTHTDCEWLVNELQHGVGEVKGKMTYPGWLPEVLVGVTEAEMAEVDGWDTLEPGSRKKFLGLKNKKQPKLEYRYYDPSTKERSAFKATLDEVSALVVGL